MKLSFLALFIAALAMLAPQSARAEGGFVADGGCRDSSLATARRVPANIPGFRIELGSVLWGGSGISMSRLSDTTETLVPTTVLPHPAERLDWLALEPLAELAPGEYLIRHPGCYGGRVLESAVTLGEAQPLPTDAGTLEVSQLYLVYVGFGEDGPLRDYFVRTRLSASEGMHPWYFVYETWTTVDGADAPTSGGSLGERRPIINYQWDRIPVGCSSEGYGVAPGRRVFRADAAPPNGRPIVSSNTVDVELRCEDALPVDYDTLRPLTPEEIAEWERMGPRPPPPSTSDGGIDLDAAALDPDVTRAPYARSGCGCSAPGPATPAAAALGSLVLAALLLVLARTRRTR